jgi:hypothetical protein
MCVTELTITELNFLRFQPVFISSASLKAKSRMEEKSRCKS